MDLTKLTVIELKALVYDEIAKGEQAQANIRILNDELKRRTNEPKVEPKPCSEPSSPA